MATTYAEHLAANIEDAEDEDEALVEAHTTIGAIGLVSKVKEDLEAAAEQMAKDWLAMHRAAIKGLNDARQEVYRQIQAMSSDPLPVEIARPHVWLQPTTAKEPMERNSNLNASSVTCFAMKTACFQILSIHLGSQPFCGQKCRERETLAGIATLPEQAKILLALSMKKRTKKDCASRLRFLCPVGRWRRRG